MSDLQNPGLSSAGESALYPRRITIDGLPVDAFRDRDSLFERIFVEIEKGGPAIVLSLNVHATNAMRRASEARHLYEEANVVYCDGSGIVLASRILGTPLAGRITAADWLDELLRGLAIRGRTAYFIGGTKELAEAGRAWLDRTVPRHTVLGLHHGHILSDPALEEEAISRINELKPDVLFVGFGMPLQEQWIARNRGRLEVRMIWALGATLKLYTGHLPRAPDWMRRNGLEWLYRLVLEPRRLFGRYVIGNPRFLARVLRERLFRSVT